MFNKPVLCITLFFPFTFALSQETEQSNSSSVHLVPSAHRPNFNMELVKKPHYRVFSKPLLSGKIQKSLPKRLPPRPKKVTPAAPPPPATGPNTIPLMEISEATRNSVSLISTGMLQEQELKKDKEVADSGFGVKSPTTQKTSPKKADVLLETARNEINQRWMDIINRP